ncbi:Homocysteine S-methyltransferase [Popillia japonica]|uniref:Homocysteine S-methyltransferase n=1 Tax=Popillia japonica TaxID=7064 RepID=A0AAW1LVF6_POPJA
MFTPTAGLVVPKNSYTRAQTVVRNNYVSGNRQLNGKEVNRVARRDGKLFYHSSGRRVCYTIELPCQSANRWGCVMEREISRY